MRVRNRHVCAEHLVRMVPTGTGHGICCPKCHPELVRKPGRPFTYRVA